MACGWIYRDTSVPWATEHEVWFLPAVRQSQVAAQAKVGAPLESRKGWDQHNHTCLQMVEVEVEGQVLDLTLLPLILAVGAACLLGGFVCIWKSWGYSQILRLLTLSIRHTLAIGVIFVTHIKISRQNQVLEYSSRILENNLSLHRPPHHPRNSSTTVQEYHTHTTRHIQRQLQYHY